MTTEPKLLIEPEPVNPSLIEAREICAKVGEYLDRQEFADLCRAGHRDAVSPVVFVLDALRRLELGREKRPVLTRELFDRANDAAEKTWSASEVNSPYSEHLFTALQEQLNK